MTEPALVAIDLGTTRLKVVAFDRDGRLLAREATRNDEQQATLEDGSPCSLQSPDRWWTDTVDLTRRLLARSELAGHEVAGVSLSGRGGGFVATDADGEVVAGSWSDRRHVEELESVAAWRRDGWDLANYAMALVAKWQWLQRHEAASAERVRRIMYAKDFLHFRLTGEAVTDPTSGPDGMDFDAAAIAELGIERSLLPRVDLPWTVGGVVTALAAEATGLPAGTPVAVGGHDGICANVGAGAGAVGTYAITIGTHAVVRAVTAEVPEGSYRFYGLPPHSHIIGGNAVLAGRAADWFLDGWYDRPSEAARPEVFALADAEAATVPIGADGVRFLPFLAGQVAPESRPGATAGFVGLQGRHGRAEMYRAVLEGGAFAIRAIFEQVRGWCGDPTVVRFTGSGAQSEVWARIITDALRWRCEATDHVAEARGAAIYAAVALGWHSDVDAAAAAMVHPSARLEPDPAAADRYDAVYADWRVVNEAMRPLDGRASGALL
jgi:xylulokinase